jgi:hypothetical protein
MKPETPNTSTQITMKTKSFHHSNMGRFGAGLPTNTQGYVTIHDSPRYRKATDDQLGEWAESRTKAVRAAALTEQAEREIRKWRAEGEGKV